MAAWKAAPHDQPMEISSQLMPAAPRFFKCRNSSCPSLVILLWLFVMLTPRVEAEDRSYWIDPNTHLTWAASDNGSGISLSQAKRYCSGSTLGGFKDWVLPSIDQLQQIFDGARNENGRHVKGPVKLSGWEWSSTPGQQDGEGWVLDFGDGARASVAAGDSGLNRALCVRRP
jgi:Protein of unknown function (DUF1566)